MQSGDGEMLKKQQSSRCKYVGSLP